MLPPAAYRLIHMTRTPSSTLQADTTESGHRAAVHLEEHVVDRGAVALLDDLDRLDVAARLTDRGRDPAQRPGDVGQLDSQEEWHSPDPRRCR